MKGYAYIEQGKSGYIEKPMPLCGDNDAIVKPTVIAVCSSDVHTVRMGDAPKGLVLGHRWGQPICRCVAR